MNGYIINFAVYSFAMTGFLISLLFIYKKAVSAQAPSDKKKFLEVKDMLKLTPAKTIYVIKAGSEKFLIAGDPSNTNLLAKLENNPEEETASEQPNTPEFPAFNSLQPFNILGFIREQAMKKFVIKPPVTPDKKEQAETIKIES